MKMVSYISGYKTESVTSQTAIQHYSTENFNDQRLFKNSRTWCSTTQWPDFGNIFYRSYEAKYILHAALEMSTVTDVSASVVQMSHYQH
jgi:hypothetical protein